MKMMTDTDSDSSEGHPLAPPAYRVRVKQEVVVEESTDDEDEEKEVTFHEDCHVIQNSLTNFFFNGEDDSDSDTSQIIQNPPATGRSGDRGPIHPDCLPAANEKFNIFQRTSPLTSLSSIEAPIKDFIASMINSKKDPKSCQEFYALIHRQLYIAMRHNLISSPEELDSYWVKFDNWAAYAYEKNPHLKDVYLEEIQLANNPSVKSPNLTEQQEDRQIPQHFYRISGTDSYKNRMIGRMETTVHKFIVEVGNNPQNKGLPVVTPVRKDIRSRVKFYLKWRSYNYLNYKTFLDFYWNVFLNRKPEYYRSHPLPKHLLVKEPQQQRKKMRNFQSVRNEVLRRKKFRKERIIKNCVNECIDNGIDPRASHKFHWTIHRCLQAVYGEFPENRISVNEMLRMWRKFDGMAVKAFEDNVKFDIVPSKGNGEFYEDAGELPPLSVSLRQAVTLPKLRGFEELNELLTRNLKEFVVRFGYGDGGEINPILGNVEIRREFLMRYVNQVGGNLGEGEEGKNLNFIWRELVSRKCNMYKGWRKIKQEEKEMADRLIDKSQRGRVRKGVTRFSEEWTKSPATSAQSPAPKSVKKETRKFDDKGDGTGPRSKKLKYEIAGAGAKSSSISNGMGTGGEHGNRIGERAPLMKKFNMDRIVKNGVNLCIELGEDPRTCHKFYWTVDRCIQYKFKKDLEEEAALEIWKMYDALAVNAFLEKKKFAILPPKGTGNYFEDVDELELECGGNLEWKLSLVQLKAHICSSVIGLLMKFGDGGDVVGGGRPILEDVAIRRKFFLSYANKLGENGNLMMGHAEIDKFWVVLVNENGEKFGIGLGKGESIAPGWSDQGASDEYEDSLDDPGEMTVLFSPTVSPKPMASNSNVTMDDSATVPMTKFEVTNLNVTRSTATAPSKFDPDPSSPAKMSTCMPQTGIPPPSVPVAPQLVKMDSPGASPPVISTSLPNEVIAPPPAPAQAPQLVPVAPNPQPAMGFTQGELCFDISNAKQREFFLQFMSCFSNKCVVKVQPKAELLQD